MCKVVGKKEEKELQLLLYHNKRQILGSFISCLAKVETKISVLNLTMMLENCCSFFKCRLWRYTDLSLNLIRLLCGCVSSGELLNHSELIVPVYKALTHRAVVRIKWEMHIKYLVRGALSKWHHGRYHSLIKLRRILRGAQDWDEGPLISTGRLEKETDEDSY